MGKKQDQPFDEKQIDEWLKNGHKPEDVKTLLQQITKAVLERGLQGEMTEHLGYAKNEVAEKNTDNSRNGTRWCPKFCVNASRRDCVSGWRSS